ncbi:DUF222 domain-containing protein [Fodinicola feengrottensis]|uniref:DUF222 domain-containing protein n=1 Tax=Fodinicola feengrottensis TaxID=435914 RepID=UPI0013CFC1CB|nr:DUF222 domain-containing protein [Fodinicola feengrottensis]
MAAGDEVADPELWMCKPRQLVDLLRAAEQDIRRRQARALDIVAAIHRNRVGKALGHDNTMRLLQDNLLLSPTEAGRRLKRALNLCSSQALTGETLVPKLGLVSDAMRRGELADSHIDTILGIVNRLPARVNIEEREGAEASLVEHAKHHPARRLVELGQRIHDHLDPDGPAPPERENEKPRRELSLHTGRDGRLNFRGSFDGETGTLLTEILSPLAKPHPTQDGHRDERSVSQRNGDALAEALNLVADSGKLPVQGQERPHLTIPWTGLGTAPGTSRCRVRAHRHRYLSRIRPQARLRRGHHPDASGQEQRTAQCCPHRTTHSRAPTKSTHSAG